MDYRSRVIWGSQADEQPLQQQRARLEALVTRSLEIHEIDSHLPEDAWVIGFKEKLRVASQDFRKDAIVYRVPGYLRNPNRTKDYTPRVVSIGPYHNGSAPLQEMERYKWKFLQQVLDRTGQDVKLYLDSMKELEPRARACYGKELELFSSDQFVEMMLLDGCFMLEILQEYADNYPIFSNAAIGPFINEDLIMLENQIPLFVLDKLHQLQHINHDGKSNVVELAVAFSHKLMPTTNIVRIERLSEMETKISARTMITPNTSTGPSRMRNPQSDECNLHFLNLVRERFLYGGPERLNVDYERCEKLNYCATELRDAGIKFKKGNNDRLWNIAFDNGVLYIPPIIIDKKFKLLFFNLLAFEQCHLSLEPQHITSYVGFLDDLIDSPEDVRYLKSHGIIQHFEGSDADVAAIINKSRHRCVVEIEAGYLSPLSCRINDYRNQSWNIWRATLKKRYFNNPWAIISFVAAVLLLIMTAAQTFYAVYSFYRFK